MFERALRQQQARIDREADRVTKKPQPPAQNKRPSGPARPRQNPPTRPVAPQQRAGQGAPQRPPATRQAAQRQAPQRSGESRPGPAATNKTPSRLPKPPVNRRTTPASGQTKQGKKQPTTIEELIPALVRFAVRQDSGLTTEQFDKKFMPMVRGFVPESLERMADEVMNEYLVDIAHAIYTAIVVGRFSSRPVLCGVRAAELAADLVERVMNRVKDRGDKRITMIRGANLLVGLTYYSVRLIESTQLEAESLNGFTESFERAVITTFGLKTQAEATGQAPWVGNRSTPLQKRIGKAINIMSTVFGEYINRNSENMRPEQYEAVLGEFDGFMDRFAPYIESRHDSAEERRKRLTEARKRTSNLNKDDLAVPLTITSTRTRPAGVEFKTADKKHYFLSMGDIKKLLEAAKGEVDDTASRERKELEERRGTAP